VENLLAFAAMLALNRACFGLATTFFLARYLDMIAGGDDRRRAMGWYGGTQAAGYTSANALVGIIADLLGYQAAFLYGTTFSAIAIGFLLWAPSLSPRDGESSVRGRGGHGLRGLLGHVNDPGLWGTLNVVSWNNLFHLVLTGFFPVFATGVGMGPTQIGLTRAVYSGVNAVGRPIAGIAIERLSLHRSILAGLGVQALLLFCVPFVIHNFPVLLTLFVISATGRCVVVVANSVQLVEDVDESRVSRGVATSAYSLASDVTQTLGPLGTGALAAAIGIGPMFSAMALGAASLFLLGQAGVTRWRSRVPSTAPIEATA
jgi:predicted MFS family arabinose efflux permease